MCGRKNNTTQVPIGEPGTTRSSPHRAKRYLTYVDTAAICSRKGIPTIVYIFPYKYIVCVDDIIIIKMCTYNIVLYTHTLPLLMPCNNFGFAVCVRACECVCLCAGMSRLRTRFAIMWMNSSLCLADERTRACSRCWYCDLWFDYTKYSM